VGTQPDDHLYDLLTNLNRDSHGIALDLLMIGFVMLSWGNRGQRLARRALPLQNSP
jgi:hypothetical protein